MSDLHALTLHDLSCMIAARDVSVLEATDALIARCEGLAERVRAFAATTFDQARDMARAADAELAAGPRRSALHGIPVGLKDTFDTAGVPATVCSRLHAHRVPPGTTPRHGVVCGPWAPRRRSPPASFRRRSAAAR